MNVEKSVAVVVLAAGSSQRMGQRKQLLKIGPDALVRRTAQRAFESLASCTVVSVEAGDLQVSGELQGLEVKIAWVENPQLGQSESIRTGLELAAAQGVNAILFTPCDLPLLTSRHLNDLISAYRANEVMVVASEYDGVLGAPMVIDKAFWNEVRELRGDVGARKIIGRYSDKTVSISWEGGKHDLDTPEDVAKFLALNNQETP